MILDELSKGPEQLKDEVISPGWCVSCGACVELCPYIKSEGDRVAVVHNCALTDGNCYKVCPRTFTDYTDLAGDITSSSSDAALGAYREVLQARSSRLEISGAAQYGGVVSTLAVIALEDGFSDAALLTLTDGIYPRPVLARNRQQVLEAAGSKYGVCPGLSGLNRALRSGIEQVTVVGRPCQVTALRKMQLKSSVEGREKVGLILGLFCFWALDYVFYDQLKTRYGATSIKHADIPREAGISLDTDQGKITLSLEETRRYVRRGCHSCADPTSELADLAIGSTEGDPAWCTLIIRTKKGGSLVNRAKDKGLLETRPCPRESLKALSDAALNKKKRVLEGKAESPSVVINNSYLRFDDETCRQIRGEGV